MQLTKFLWQGGKRNGKKFHLVNWHIVKLPKDQGGLAIKYLNLMNLAMGDKIVWILVTGEMEWWKLALEMKYFGRMNLSQIENLNSEGKKSQIWRLCKEAPNLIIDNLRWQPGNG